MSDSSTTADRVRRQASSVDQLMPTITRAVADLNGRDPSGTVASSERIDPVALETLFGGSATGKSIDEGYLVFTMEGCLVVVHRDGLVEVVPRDHGPITFTGAELVTTEDFRSSLRRLVHAAYQNAVDVEGSWPLRDDSGVPDYETEITRLASSRVR